MFTGFISRWRIYCRSRNLKVADIWNRISIKV